MGRLERVNEHMKVEVSRIIQEELKDPRVGFVTVMRAEVSADLQHAHLYVSCLGTPAEQERTMTALTSGRGFVRRMIGERIRLRYTPEIVFHLDHSLDDQFRIQDTLERIRREHQELT